MITPTALQQFPMQMLQGYRVVQERHALCGTERMQALPYGGEALGAHALLHWRIAMPCLGCGAKPLERARIAQGLGKVQRGQRLAVVAPGGAQLRRRLNLFGNQE
jgi:hypothetical protein